RTVRQRPYPAVPTLTTTRACWLAIPRTPYSRRAHSEIRCADGWCSGRSLPRTPVGCADPVPAPRLSQLELHTLPLEYRSQRGTAALRSSGRRDSLRGSSV